MRFTVQQEAFIQGKWHPIVRYDTTHGFVHRDTIHPDGTEDKQLLDFVGYKEAFTAAIEDIKFKHTFYRRRYERWRMKGEP